MVATTTLMKKSDKETNVSKTKDIPNDNTVGDQGYVLGTLVDYVYTYLRMTKQPVLCLNVYNQKNGGIDEDNLNDFDINTFLNRSSVVQVDGKQHTSLSVSVLIEAFLKIKEDRNKELNKKETHMPYLMFIPNDKFYSQSSGDTGHLFISGIGVTTDPDSAPDYIVYLHELNFDECN